MVRIGFGSTGYGRLAGPVLLAISLAVGTAHARAPEPEAGPEEVRATADSESLPLYIPPPPPEANLPEVEPIIPYEEFESEVPELDAEDDPELDRPLESIEEFERRLAAEEADAEPTEGQAPPLGDPPPPAGIVTEGAIHAARREALGVHVSDALEEYMVQLVLATRGAEGFGAGLAGRIAFGASPRGTIALDRCARVHAWMRGADFATPLDVQAVAHDVLRHRLILTFEAEADGVTKDSLIDELIALVPVS